MLGLPPPENNPQSRQRGRQPNPFTAIGNPDGTDNPSANDPMMAMLQQMMGGAEAEPGAMPSFPGLPPMGFSDLGLNGTTTINTYGYIWRIVHAVFALGFGLYIACNAEIKGTSSSRDRGDGGVDLRAFYTFATVEAILQGTRLLFDRGQANQDGLLGMVLRFLPEPFAGYLKIFMNYRSIWTTTSADVMVLVFVLVAASHWRMSGES